jgi:3-dehydroquinate synthase
VGRERGQMKKVRVNLDRRSYDIIIKEKCIAEASEYLEKLNLPRRAVIISNNKIYSLYGDSLSKNLKKSGYEIHTILAPDGENAKTLSQAEKIYHELLKYKLNRETLLFALGGGIIGDLAGYVASSYLRGVPFVQVPTSLLAQVDSSVGGKVAVNLPEGKNLIGHFYQPAIVLIDPSCLKTLPEKEVINGMAEVIKYGLIMDRPFFEFLVKNSKKINSLDPAMLERMIFESVRNKVTVVINDETEKNMRAILNFGHTFGHAIEKTFNYNDISHGEAVAIGMNLACLLSVRKGFLKKDEWDKIKPVFSMYHLTANFNTGMNEEILKNLYYDKKMTNRGLKFILIKQIGSVFQTTDVKETEIRDIMDER